MTFSDAILTGFNKFATFQGRATRSEYWYFTLFLVLVNIILTIIDTTTGIGVLSSIFTLVTLFPAIAVSVRRLHDNNLSGWWFLSFLIPILGSILLLFWCCSKGTTGSNRFGDDPLGGNAVLAVPEVQA